MSVKWRPLESGSVNIFFPLKFPTNDKETRENQGKYTSPMLILWKAYTRSPPPSTISDRVVYTYQYVYRQQLLQDTGNER